MEFRPLGRSGLQVSVLGLGCNNFGMRLDEAASVTVVHASLDAGISFFDTANSYGGGQSEAHLGKALAGYPRDEVVIATKFGSKVGDGPYAKGASRKHIESQCEISLRRLGTEYVDLYYLHRPDPETPIDETLAALDDLVHAGKVRYVACSNLSGWQLARADAVARRHHASRFEACQSEWSLVNRTIEAEVVPACEELGVGMVPYFPLASGLLTGKYTRGEAAPEGSRLAVLPMFAGMATDAVYDAVDRLGAVATTLDRSLADVAIGWLASKPVVSSVLVGATTAEQVRQNAASAQVRFDAAEIEAITAAAAPAPAG
jgi:aryl-alcohol dehydrogenase-like predicted oxidoreductase